MSTVMDIEIISCLKVFSFVNLYFFNFFNNSLCLLLGWDYRWLYDQTTTFASIHLCMLAHISQLLYFQRCVNVFFAPSPLRLCPCSTTFALQVNQFEFIFALVSNLVKTVSVCSANFSEIDFCVA